MLPSVTNQQVSAPEPSFGHPHAWSIGYADAYQESYRIFSRLRAESVLAPGIRFQVQYPTPLASINAWFSAADQARVEPSYERAIVADLDRC